MSRSAAALNEARRDPELVVLEGFHALKHALRFGGEIVSAFSPDLTQLDELAAKLSSDLVGRFSSFVEVVSADQMAALLPRHDSREVAVVAIAKRPSWDLALQLADVKPEPIIFLEDPRRLGNIGAAVRVAAATSCAALITSGSSDPWHPDAIRGGAGLQFALPVGRVDSALELIETNRELQIPRQLVAIDPDGEPLASDLLSPGAILCFGTERHGVSDEFLNACDLRLRIPMRAGVSSLNLATSVAAVMYGQALISSNLSGAPSLISRLSVSASDQQASAAEPIIATLSPFLPNADVTTLH